jgi:endonuclease/exonuclease/phosphatase family metal-dependent hydrolase
MTRLFAALAFFIMLTTAVRAEPISVAAWNVETFHFFETCKRLNTNGNCVERTASGSSPAVSGLSLRDDFNGIDFFALQEVSGEEEAEAFAILADQDEKADYRHLFGRSGGDIRVALIFSSARFELLRSLDLDFASTSGGSRKPLAAKFRARRGGQDFWVVAVHLTRGETKPDGTGAGDLRNDAQSQELREWIEAQAEPVIVLGDFNYDVNFATGQQRIGFKTFTQNGGPLWVRPAVDIDTNWSGSMTDEHPDSILDFVFVSQKASAWKRLGVAYRRPGDFPDSWRTADHRPVVAFFETSASAELTIDLAARLPKLIQTPEARFERRAASVAMAATTASPAVMERLAQAEAAEQRTAEQVESQPPPALAGALSLPQPHASRSPRPPLDAMLETLADMVAERLAAQRR